MFIFYHARELMSTTFPSLVTRINRWIPFPAFNNVTKWLCTLRSLIFFIRKVAITMFGDFWYVLSDFSSCLSLYHKYLLFMSGLMMISLVLG